MASQLTIVFATPQGEDSPTIVLNFPDEAKAMEVSTTVRVGGTPYPWATYVQSAEDQ